MTELSSLKLLAEEYVASLSVKPTTARLYEWSLEKFFDHMESDGLKNFTTDAIRDFASHRLKTTSSATRNRDLRVIRSFCNWLEENEYLSNNPFRKLKRYEKQLPVLKRSRPQWSPDDFRAVLAMAGRSHPEWRLFALLTINGVARRRKLAKAKVNDVDLERGTIRVLDDKPNEERIVPLHPLVLKELREYIEKLEPGRTNLFSRTFHSNTWVGIVRRARVPHMTMDHLRGLTVSWLQSRGVPTATIAAIFGHAKTYEDHSLLTPVVTYRHDSETVDQDLIRQAVATLPLITW